MLQNCIEITTFVLLNKKLKHCICYVQLKIQNIQNCFLLLTPNC